MSLRPQILPEGAPTPTPPTRQWTLQALTREEKALSLICRSWRLPAQVRGSRQGIHSARGQTKRKMCKQQITSPQQCPAPEGVSLPFLEEAKSHLLKPGPQLV